MVVQHTPSLSVIIPAFNAARTIAETIDSVLLQSFCDYEVLVIDDGSCDHTAAIVEAIVDDRVRMIRQSNAGNAAARNRGALESCGTWLCFLDADDLWDPRKLESQINDLLAHPEARASFPGAQWFDEQGQTRTLPAGPPTEDLWSHLVSYQPFGASLSGVMVERSAFFAAGGFDESLRLSVDWDMWIRLADTATIRCLPERLVHIRLHDGNATGNAEVRLNTYLECLRKHRRLFSERGLRRAWGVSFGSRCMRLGRHRVKSGRPADAITPLLTSLRFGGLSDWPEKMTLLIEALVFSAFQSRSHHQSASASRA
jgi:glycosyltransferase involved in cell wall biosynthesis